MHSYLLIGNIFSLLSALCIAMSAAKSSKKGFMFWQIGDAFFSILTNIALLSYSATVMNIICLLRNILYYKNRLTKQITIIMAVACVVIGAWANNRGIIGWFPIVATTSFTIFVYTTKTGQQMRYVLISNMLLWFVHNIYIQSYPLAAANIILSGWAGFQAYKRIWIVKKATDKFNKIKYSLGK